MIWIDVQRMQILPTEPSPKNAGIPYMELRAFIDASGAVIRQDVLQFGAPHEVPALAYFSVASGEYVATLRLAPDDTPLGWKPVVSTD